MLSRKFGQQLVQSNWVHTCSPWMATYSALLQAAVFMTVASCSHAGPSDRKKDLAMSLVVMPLCSHSMNKRTTCSCRSRIY